MPHDPFQNQGQNHIKTTKFYFQSLVFFLVYIVS